jgi:hypothetical protein
MTVYSTVVFVGVTPNFNKYKIPPRVDAGQVNYGELEEFFKTLPSSSNGTGIIMPSDYIDLADMEMMLKLGDSGGLKVYADDLLDMAEANGFNESLFNVPRWHQHHVLKDRAKAAPPGIIPILSYSTTPFYNVQWYFELCEDLNIKAANVSRIVDTMQLSERDFEGKMPQMFKSVIESVFNIEFIDRVTVHRPI